jgi:hypothetical protein
MNKRFVLTFIVSLSIVSLGTALEVQQAKADATIYIRADGSVDPPSAPIQHMGDAYALTGDRSIANQPNRRLNGENQLTAVS